MILDNYTKEKRLEIIGHYLPEYLEDFEVKNKLEQELPGYLHLADYEQEAQHIVEHPNEIRGLATGYPRLDNLLLGLSPGELVTIGGQSGSGKTMLATSLLLGAYQSRPEPDLKTLICSFDQTVPELTARLIQQAQPTQLDGLVPSLPIFFYDHRVDPSLLRLRKTIEKLKADEGLDLVIVDHIGCFPSQGQNRTESVSLISRALKQLAVQHEIVVIALSQVNRQTDEGLSTADNLRDSGMIRADSDTVVMVNRNQLSEETKNYVQVSVEKNRGKGRTGRVLFTIGTGSYLLRELDKQMEQHIKAKYDFA